MFRTGTLKALSREYLLEKDPEVRFSAEAADELNRLLSQFTAELLSAAIYAAAHSGRVTVQGKDIIYAYHQVK